MYPTSEHLQGLLRDATGSAAARPSFSRLFYPDDELVRRLVHARTTTLLGEEPLAGEMAMIEALTLLLERYSTPRRSRRRVGKERLRISKTVEYIEANLESPLTLAEIAGVSGLSRFHFLRVFKHETGSTPFTFLMQRRVERARYLIRSGTAIAEAAYGAGFADQAHLCRRFRQIVGVTPGEFARGTKALRTAPQQANNPG